MKSEERRIQILEKAVEVFSAHGLSGARTRDIAEACDINEAVIYKHFKSKEELFRESLFYNQADLMKSVFEDTLGEPDGLTTLRKAMEVQIPGVIINKDVRAFILHGVAAATLDKEMYEWTSGWFFKQNDFIRNQLVRGIDDGSVNPDIDVEMEVWHVKGAGWACLLAGIFGLPDEEVSGLARKLYKTVIDSVTAK